MTISAVAYKRTIDRKIPGLESNTAEATALGCFIYNVSSSSSANCFSNRGNYSPGLFPCLLGQLISKASLNYLQLFQETELAFPTAFCWHIPRLTQSFTLLLCPWEITSRTKKASVSMDKKLGTSPTFLFLFDTHTPYLDLLKLLSYFQPYLLP